MKQLALDLVEPPSPTLDDFIAGRNAELLESLRRLVSATGERFIYLWGETGSGRTHLLRAVVGELQAAGARALYVSCGGASGITFDNAEADCVAADDVEQLDDAGQIALFGLYNRLRERRGALVASGNAPPSRLKLRQDLVTRLGWGLVYQTHALTDEEKAAALRHHATARGFTLPDEVCGFLLNRVRRDMPTLLKVLESLDRYSLAAQRPVTVALARELLAGKDEG